MKPYYCVFKIAEQNPNYSGNQDLSKLEGKCLPEIAVGSGILGIPVFTMFNENCASCTDSTGNPDCDEFDLLVGYISFGEDYDTLFQLFDKYEVGELNELARYALIKATGFGSDSSAFDFCDNECYVVGLNIFDDENTAVSPYYTEISGHCKDSINHPEYSMLAANPPDDLVETYFRCKPTVMTAFFDSVGIANGNTALFAPLVCLLLLVPFIKFYFKTTGQHLHEEEYTNEDKDAAGREMMKYLICISQGKTKISSNSVIAQFVAELQQLAIADKEQKLIQRKRKSTLAEDSETDETRFSTSSPMQNKKKTNKQPSHDDIGGML
jgi:hypothetical protein